MKHKHWVWDDDRGDFKKIDVWTFFLTPKMVFWFIVLIAVAVIAARMLGG